MVRGELLELGQELLSGFVVVAQGFDGDPALGEQVVERGGAVCLLDAYELAGRPSASAISSPPPRSRLVRTVSLSSSTYPFCLAISLMYQVRCPLPVPGEGKRHAGDPTPTSASSR
jgi:hypothetical protein